MASRIAQLKIPLAIVLGFVLFGLIVRDRSVSVGVPVEAPSEVSDGTVPEIASPEPVRGGALTTVSFVVNGDTFELGSGERVRLIGIDTPERGKPYYAEAREALEQLTLQKAVRLERDISERDRYGRLLAYVYVGEQLVNLALVEAGMAKAYTYPPDVAHAEEFVAAERRAREAGRGLWAGDARPSATQPAAAAASGGAYTLPACASSDCDCGDFTSHAQAQWFHDTHNAGDAHRLDRDGDDRVCETLP